MKKNRDFLTIIVLICFTIGTMFWLVDSKKETFIDNLNKDTESVQISTELTSITPVIASVSSSKNISTDSLEINSLPVKVGQCTTAIVEKVGYRLEDIDGTPVVTSGSSILYTNGGYQVDYDEVPGIVNSRPNDEVILCLASIPKNCPPGDDRGRIYKAKNKRTGDIWEEADSQHSCGGA